ncbi:MAG: hypothetical protein J6Z14_04625 [Prevotella sp.]|nr:hypothetical protein [Prevotella sp.]
MNPTVVPATAVGFREAAEAPETGRICAELADMLEQFQRGELKKEEYAQLKSKQKQGLCFYTPHAHYAEGYKAGDKGPIDSGKCLLDIDNYAAGAQLYANYLKGRERVLGINAAYTTASGNGFAVLFDIPKGLTRQQAQKWMAHQLGDVDYDKGVHDLTRAAYIPCRSYFCYLDEELMFGDEPHPAVLSEDELHRWQQIDVKTEPKTATAPETKPVETRQAVTRTLYAFDETLATTGLTLEQLNREGVRHNTLKLLLPTLCQMMTEHELLGVLAERMPNYSCEQDCRTLVHDFYVKYVDTARPMTQKQRELFLRSLNVKPSANGEQTDEKTDEQPQIARKGLPISLQASLKPYPDTFIMPHLTGLMPALMALADGVTYRYCDGKIHHLGAMAIIRAEQSSNKSTVSDAVERWIACLRSEDEVARMKEEKTRSRNRVRKASERGEEAPTDVVRVVPVTISCSRLLKRLKQSQGHTLYSICEEIDTLRKSNGAGSWSAKYDIYRVAFDHSYWGQDYNGEQSESGDVEVGYNWTIMGTPGSVAKCFKNDNVENGLSSRVMMSEMPDNMFAKMPVFKELTETDLQNIEDGVTRLREAQGFYDTPRLRKTISQWVESRRVESFKEYNRVKDVYRRRAGVIGFRCGVVYMLLCGKESNACLDFAVKMAEYTLQQQMKFFGPLLMKQLRSSQEEEPQTTVNTNIYDQLPSPFTLNDLRKLKGSEFSDSAIYSIVSRWKKEGWIDKTGKNSWSKLPTQ